MVISNYLYLIKKFTSYNQDKDINWYSQTTDSRIMIGAPIDYVINNTTHN